jgi:hypothetical protein
VFTAPDHDDPQRIHYQRDGRHLRAGVGATERFDDVVVTLAARRWRSAPALEAADRAFAAAVRGAGDVAGRLEAWRGWFAPDGAQWDEEGERLVTREDGMTELMRPTLSGTLAWDPTASGLAPAGDLGFTVGGWSWTAPSGSAPALTGGYVTVWAKQPDGQWRVRFDTGDALAP